MRFWEENRAAPPPKVGEFLCAFDVERRQVGEAVRNLQTEVLELSRREMKEESEIYLPEVARDIAGVLPCLLTRRRERGQRGDKGDGDVRAACVVPRRGFWEGVGVGSLRLFFSPYARLVATVALTVLGFGGLATKWWAWLLVVGSRGGDYCAGRLGKKMERRFDRGVRCGCRPDTQALGRSRKPDCGSGQLVGSRPVLAEEFGLLLETPSRRGVCGLLYASR